MPRRRRGDDLVDNEKRVLVALAYLTNRERAPRVWAGDIPAALHALGEHAVHGATINRALNTFAAHGWVSAAWETEDPEDRTSSRPRLYYRLEPAGSSAAQDLVDTERARLAAWVADPALVGLESRHPHIAATPPRPRPAARPLRSVR